MIKWMRPSGSEIETNDLPETIEKAESLGWERADKPKAEVKPKRKRRTPAEMAAAREGLNNGSDSSPSLQSDSTEDSSSGC